MKKKDIYDLKLLGLVLNIVALCTFIIALITQQWIFTIVGYVLFSGAMFIMYYTQKQLKVLTTKNSEKTDTTEETKPKFNISEYWGKFIYWLNN